MIWTNRKNEKNVYNGGAFFKPSGKRCFIELVRGNMVGIHLKGSDRSCMVAVNYYDLSYGKFQLYFRNEQFITLERDQENLSSTIVIKGHKTFYVFTTLIEMGAYAKDHYGKELIKIDCINIKTSDEMAGGLSYDLDC